MTEKIVNIVFMAVMIVVVAWLLSTHLGNTGNATSANDCQLDRAPGATGC